MHFGLAGLIAGTLTGCINGNGKPIPEDTPRFPTGLALTPDGSHLLVVSSNFDLAFDSGAVLMTNADALTPELEAADVVIEAPWQGFVAIPSFGDKLTIDPTGRHVFVTTKAANLLHVIDIDGDDLSCDGEELCNKAPNVLQLPQNDPGDVIILDSTVDGDGALTSLRGAVSHLSANEVQLFTFRPDRNDATRLQFESAPITLAGADSVDGDVFGVRGSAFRPESDRSDAMLVFGTEDRLEGTVVGASILVSSVPGPNRGADASFTSLDVTGTVGSRAMRDVTVVEDADGAAVVAILRAPDALARFAIDERSRTLSLTALEATCKIPQALTQHRDVDGKVISLLLTCSDSQAIQRIDPRTLRVTDSVRFYGRGPLDVIVDDTRNLAWVSFNLDNSVGALSLVDDGGAPVLTPVGRLGTPLPRPEDGRE